MQLGTGFLDCFPRFRQFDLLETIGGQKRNFLSFNFSFSYFLLSMIY